MLNLILLGNTLVKLHLAVHSAVNHLAEKNILQIISGKKFLIIYIGVVSLYLDP